MLTNFVTQLNTKGSLIFDLELFSEQLFIKDEFIAFAKQDRRDLSNNLTYNIRVSKDKSIKFKIICEENNYLFNEFCETKRGKDECLLVAFKYFPVVLDTNAFWYDHSFNMIKGNLEIVDDVKRFIKEKHLYNLENLRNKTIALQVKLKKAQKLEEQKRSNRVISLKDDIKTFKKK